MAYIVTCKNGREVAVDTLAIIPVRERLAVRTTTIEALAEDVGEYLDPLREVSGARRRRIISRWNDGPQASAQEIRDNVGDDAGPRHRESIA